MVSKFIFATLIVCACVFGRSTERALNTKIVPVDTLQIDSTETVYTCGFKTDMGGAKTILLAIRDTSEAGWASDSMAFIMWLEEGFEVGIDKYVWLPSQAHPDSTIFPGGINFPDTIFSVGSTWDACTSCTYAREAINDTSFGNISTYYTTDYDSVITGHEYAYLARSYAPDFSPWIRLKFTGIGGNRYGGQGTVVIVYLIQERGIVVKEQ